MLGVVKDVVVERAVPPAAAAYQATVPSAGAVAVNTPVPVLHLEAPTAAGAVGSVFIVANTGVLVADTQPVVVNLDST